MFIYLKNKKLSNNKNYFFKFNQKQFATTLNKMNKFYVHFCDKNIMCVQIKNDKNITICFFCFARFEIFIEYGKKILLNKKKYHEITIIINIKNFEI